MECSSMAQKAVEAGEQCEYFQFSHYYPYKGCHCCESTTNAEKNSNWQIYLTCNKDSDGNCYNKDYDPNSDED